MYEFELLASGFGTLEGPTVDAEGSLYFSNVQGGVYRLAPDGDVHLVVPRRKGVAGICLHKDGGIVVAGRDLSHVKDGQSRIILGHDDYLATGLPHVTGFNDIHADDEGRIFASSVRFDEAGARIKGTAVLVHAPKRAVELYGDIQSPNGMALDAARNRLYHCASYDYRIIVSERQSAMTYRPLYDISTKAIAGVPDGVALDEEGCPWVAFYEGSCVIRFSPAGEILERLEPPATLVTSLCFAGRDGRDLIIVTGENTLNPELGGSIFRTRAPIAGAPVGTASI